MEEWRSGLGYVVGKAPTLDWTEERVKYLEQAERKELETANAYFAAVDTYRIRRRGDRMEWFAVILILVLAAWALGSGNEKTRELRAKARYMRWESTAQRRRGGRF